MWKGPHPTPLCVSQKKNDSLDSTHVSLKFIGFYPLLYSHSLAFFHSQQLSLGFYQTNQTNIKISLAIHKIIPRRLEFRKQEYNAYVRLGFESTNYQNFGQKFHLRGKTNFGLFKTLIIQNEQKILSRGQGLFFHYPLPSYLVSLFPSFFGIVFLFQGKEQVKFTNLMRIKPQGCKIDKKKH